MKVPDALGSQEAEICDCEHVMVHPADIEVWQKIKYGKRPLYCAVILMDLPLWFRSGDILDLCRKYTKVEHIDFFNEKKPTLPPFAFVHVSDESSAQMLVEKLNSKLISGKEIIVEIAHDKPFLFKD